jgi:superfamily II DNA or RNA helicase
MPTIYDNQEATILSGLERFLGDAHSLDACVGYFNFQGWKLLEQSAARLSPESGKPAVRLLIGMHSDVSYDLNLELREAALQARGVTVASKGGKKLEEALQETLLSLTAQLNIFVPTEEDRKSLIKLRDDLRSKRIRVKVALGQRLHAKLYIAHRSDQGTRMAGFVGSSNLTRAGLSTQGELNIDVLDEDATKKLAAWFNDRWEALNSIDISDRLADILDASWIQQTDPYLVHLKIAYHLSKDAREGIPEDIPSDIRSELFDFQSAAVSMAVKTLTRQRGVMIGDVVGLGKTMTATAIARTMEKMDNVETLIICPKNLEKMWKEYVRRYQLRGAEVLPLSMAAKELPDLARYRLLIIDESHNLRNAGTKAYNAVQQYISKNEPYVVLLTATPYNVDVSDLADQIGLFIADDAALPIRPDAAIRAAGGLTEFVQRVRNGNAQSLGAFRKSEEADDWRNLMGLFLVRRTRGFIKKHYAQSDERGHFLVFPKTSTRSYFPKRKPRVESVADADGEELKLAEDTVEVVKGLTLPRQRLNGYLTEAAERATDYEIVERIKGRSTSLQGIIRIGLLKRLSSSRAALLLSLQRHAVRDLSFMYALANDLPLPIGSGTFVEADLMGDGSRTYEEPEADDPDASERSLSQHFRIDASGRMVHATNKELQQFAEEAYEKVRGKKSGVEFLNPALVRKQDLLTALQADVVAITSLLERLGEVNASTDPKISALARLAGKKHKDEKVLVFSEYQDTTEYVRIGLQLGGVQGVEAVTGASENPTEYARRFSPKSNQNLGGLPEGKNEIRVLVATDVLSEGQNLQDARIVVNYDLPWATIRLVQRAGRVDRIGQQAEIVFVYTFDVGGGLDNVLRLRARIIERLHQSGVVLGSDDQFFGTEQERAVLEGLFDETKQNSFDSVAEDDVDAASYAYEVWRKAIEADPSLEQRVKSLQQGVQTTIPATKLTKNGEVIALITSNYNIDTVMLVGRDGATPISPITAVAETAVVPGQHALTPVDDHLTKLGTALNRAYDDRGQSLGAVNRINRRVYDVLQKHERVKDGLLKDLGARALVDLINQHPLRSAAAQRLAQVLKEDGDKPTDRLLMTVQNLAELDELVVKPDDLASGELALVASVGFRKE